MPGRVGLASDPGRPDHWGPKACFITKKGIQRIAAMGSNVLREIRKAEEAAVRRITRTYAFVDQVLSEEMVAVLETYPFQSPVRNLLKMLGTEQDCSEYFSRFCEAVAWCNPLLVYLEHDAWHDRIRHIAADRGDRFKDVFFDAFYRSPWGRKYGAHSPEDVVSFYEYYLDVCASLLERWPFRLARLNPLDLGQKGTVDRIVAQMQNGGPGAAPDGDAASSSPVGADAGRRGTRGEPGEIRVVRVAREDLPKLEAFVRKDAAQAQPGGPDAPQVFVEGLRKSLRSFDFLSSNSHWFLAAEVDGQYVGYLTAMRIHKADARVAVLFVDEMMVLAEYRRRGVASALWRSAQSLAQEIGAWRIRLCVDADNHAAREFYRIVGLQENPLVLCQQDSVRIPKHSPSARNMVTSRHDPIRFCPAHRHTPVARAQPSGLAPPLLQRRQADGLG